MTTEPTSASPDKQPRVVGAKRSGSRVTRFGWRLFRDDLRSGRFVALALLGLLAALVVGFATSTAYMVQAVEVVGSKAMSSEEATRLSGVAGLNIFAVDTNEVAARLRGAPYVRSLHVETQLPNTVRVVVDEQRPSIVWVAGDTPYLVNEDGSISGLATTLDGFVVVYDRDPLPTSPITATQTATATSGGPNYRVGGYIGVLAREGADAAQRIYMLLPAAGVTIQSIEYDSGLGVSVLTPPRQRIIFGGKDEIETKIAICRTTLAALGDKKWTVMDLRSTNRPAVQMLPEKKK